MYLHRVKCVKYMACIFIGRELSGAFEVPVWAEWEDSRWETRPSSAGSVCPGLPSATAFHTGDQHQELLFQNQA